MTIAPEDPEDIDALLSESRAGNTTALRHVFELVYDDLRRVARGMYRGHPEDYTLQPTALVNEAYRRIIGQRNVDPENRSQFKAVAATVIRRTLMDYLRRRRAKRHGGGLQRITIDDNLPVFSLQRSEELIALDDALNELASLHNRQAQVVERRYFGGMTIEDTAKSLRVSTATVKNDWNVARLFLLEKLRSTPPAE